MILVPHTPPRLQANDYHSTVGLPHTSGPKWAAQQGGALIAAQCSGALGCISRYAGDFATEIYNVSSVRMIGEWVFVEPANFSSSCGIRGCEAWAAVRYAWGGLNASAPSVSEGVAGSGNHSFLLVPTDPWAPVVLFAGNGSTFGSFQQFVDAVVHAELDVSTPSGDGSRIVSFTPPSGSIKPCPRLCKTITFPWSLDKASHMAPRIGGDPMEDQPAMAYSGPYMQSILGGDTVVTSSGPASLRSAGGGVRELFNFSTDTISQLDVLPKIL